MGYVIECETGLRPVSVLGAQGAIIIVDGGGSGNYTGIQSAVDNASAGDTINIWSGLYRENVTVNKTLIIKGNGSKTTTLDGEGCAYGFYVNAIGVKISGIHVTNCTGSNPAGGILLDGVQNCTVSDCRLTNSTVGVYLVQSQNCMVRECFFTNLSQTGVELLSSSHNNVDNNSLIWNQGGYDIALSSTSLYNHIGNNTCVRDGGANIWVSNSAYSVIDNNTCTTGTWRGIWLHRTWYDTISYNVCNNNGEGIYLDQANYLDINNNTMNNNTWAGLNMLHIYLTRQSTIRDNVCLNNQWGMRVSSIEDPVITGNNCSYNSVGGIECWGLQGNVTIAGNTFISNGYGLAAGNPRPVTRIYHNNFINNSMQAHAGSGADWDDGAGMGNYWSCYTGSDNGANGRTAGDGVGDTNLPHMADYSEDYYPLMKPWGWLRPMTPVLSNPGNFSSTGNVSLNWSAASRSTGYVVQEDTNAYFPTPKNVYSGVNTTVNLTGQSNGTYFYRVHGVNARFSGPWSNVENITVKLPPGAPSGFTLTPPSGGNSVDISWERLEGDHLLYTLFYSGGSSRAEKTFLAHVPYPGTFFNHTGLTNGQSYSYWARVTEENGLQSALSFIGTATPADLLAPVTPYGLLVTDTTDSTVTLEWVSATDLEVRGYNVYRSETVSHTTWGEPVNPSPLSIGAFIDTGLEELTIYHYTVTALDDVPNESGFCPSVPATTLLGQHGPEPVDPPASIEIYEDTSDDETVVLSEWFLDVNGDELEFDHSSSEHIEVTIEGAKGEVTFEPEPDWCGEVVVEFYASDGFRDSIWKLNVTVIPVNDPPELPTITSPIIGTSVKEGTLITLTGNCTDPDMPYDEVLAFSWSSNVSGPLGTGSEVDNIALPEGVHEIELLVTDMAGATSSALTEVMVIGSEEPETEEITDGEENLEGNITEDGPPDGTDNAIPSGKDGKDEGDLKAALAIAIGLAVLVVLAITLTIIWYRRRRPQVDEGTDKPESTSPVRVTLAEEEVVEPLASPAPALIPLTPAPTGDYPRLAVPVAAGVQKVPVTPTNSESG